MSWIESDQQRERDLIFFLSRNHYLCGTFTLDGRVIFVKRTAAEQGQLCISASLDEMSGISDTYSYPTIKAAWHAWVQWDFKNFVGEPEGWIRHQPSNRRRRNGNSSTEEIRP